MIERARAIAETMQDPYLLGFTAITVAQIRMVEAEWKEMLEFCDSASDLLRARCRGITWELDISCMAALRALEELGRLVDLHRRAEQLLQRAQEEGDLYGVAQGLLFEALYRLFVNDAATARRLAIRILQLWGAKRFDMPAFYVFRLESYRELAEGRAYEARERIQRTWPHLRRSGMLGHLLLRSDAHLLRARTALSIARSGTADRETMLQTAEAGARQLAGEGRPDTSAHALCLNAGVAAVRGERTAAIGMLNEAVERFERASMAMCAALARRRAGELIGGDTGRELMNEAGEFFEREGISDPSALLAMYAPGFDSR
jgi:hypothetical protein